MFQLNRREWLGSCMALPALAALPAFAALPGSKAPLLLRSSWQTVNIGDVAHTPGMLTLLENISRIKKSGSGLPMSTMG